MTRYAALLFFLTCFGMAALGQDAGLQQLLSLADDTSKVHKLAAFARQKAHENPPLSREVSNTILQLSRRLRYNEGIATGYSFLGYFELHGGKCKTSIPYYKEAISYYKKANNEEGVAKCLGNVSTAYEGLGKMDSGTIYRLQAIALLEKLASSPTTSWQVKHLLSLQYFNQAALYENTFSNFNKALSYYQQALGVARQNNDTAMLVASLNGVAQSQTAMRRSTEASAAADEALRLAKVTNENELLAQGYEANAIVLNARNETDAAIATGRLAVDYARKSAFIGGFVISSINLSDALGKKGLYKEQIGVLTNLLKKRSEIDNLEKIWTIYGALAEAHLKTGNHKAAYDYLNAKTLYKDSVIKLESNRITADMEARYQTAQKEKALVEKQLQLQKSHEFIGFSIGAAIVALLLAGLTLFYYKNKRRLHRHQLQALQQQKEIQLLQALMDGEEKERARLARDLHDGIAGMLSAMKMQLSGFLQRNGGAAACELSPVLRLLDDTSHEVRLTSHNLMPEVLLQHGLDEALRRYCANISSRHALSVQYDSLGEIGRFKEGFELAVYRMVQELLNNILKHSKAATALVQVSHHDRVLTVTVEDDGAGFTGKSQEGMGLQTIRSRVKALNGTMDLSTDGEKGVNVYLEFETAAVVSGEPPVVGCKLQA